MNINKWLQEFAEKFGRDEWTVKHNKVEEAIKRILRTNVIYLNKDPDTDKWCTTCKYEGPISPSSPYSHEDYPTHYEENGVLFEYIKETLLQKDKRHMKWMNTHFLTYDDCHQIKILLWKTGKIVGYTIECTWDFTTWEENV